MYTSISEFTDSHPFTVMITQVNNSENYNHLPQSSLRFTNVV